MLKFALCNEAFQDASWADTVRTVAATGYDGIEIAPFTLADSVTDLSLSRRQELRRQAEDAGLDVVGLHWLFVSPKGLHATTDDPLVRQQTTDYLQALVDFCGDLGGKVMVVGSPQQRNVQPGVSPQVAWQRFVDMIVACLDLAAARGVTLCMEALPPDQCNFVTTLAQAVEMVRQVNHPNFQTMFDVHNAHMETDPLPELVRRYMPYLRHVHVNEMDGRYPGAGDFDFDAVLRVFREADFDGYISTEVFDFEPGAAFIAREAIRHLKKTLA